jgi:type II secretory pathway component HofQ
MISEGLAFTPRQGLHHGALDTDNKHLALPAQLTLAEGTMLEASMARSPRSTSSKARAGGKARGGSSKGTRAAKKSTSKRAASRSAAPSQRTSKAPASSKGAASRASKKSRSAHAQGRMRQAQLDSWATNISSLLSSQPGRDILAEALDAAAAVLRRDRGGQQAAEALTTAADAAT